MVKNRMISTALSLSLIIVGGGALASGRGGGPSSYSGENAGYPAAPAASRAGAYQSPPEETARIKKALLMLNEAFKAEFIARTPDGCDIGTGDDIAKRI